jgi:hypothetical protein
MTTREGRKEKQIRRLGVRLPRCKSCGQSKVAALTGTEPNIICYECQAKNFGRSPIEKHHIAGRSNDSFTVSIPANDHRVLSDRQIDWPLETLRNPNGDPVLKVSATIRGWSDILHEIIEHILGWIPEFLEALAAFLVEKLGNRWWEQMPNGGGK